jgi:hypothetical protein
LPGDLTKTSDKERPPMKIIRRILSAIVLPLSFAFLVEGLATTCRAEIVAAWGSDNSVQVSGAPTGTGFTAIAGGLENGLALRADGSIAVWGSGNEALNVPTGTGFTAIAGGGETGYALHAESVPEPGSFALLASGAVGLFLGVRRRRSASRDESSRR